MYDEAKRYGEALTMTFAQARGVDACIIRIFNTYGPRMDPDDGRVISNFITQALRGAPLSIYGDGSHTRSFQYVDDLVEGMLKTIASRCRGPINLGNPVEFTMLQLACLVQELTGTSSLIEFRPLPQDDPRQRRPDISLAKSTLNWEPTVPLRDGLQRTIAYFQGLVDAVRPSNTTYYIRMMDGRSHAHARALVPPAE